LHQAFEFIQQYPKKRGPIGGEFFFVRFYPDAAEIENDAVLQKGANNGLPNGIRWSSGRRG
jgi:hypothetical protein